MGPMTSRPLKLITQKSNYAGNTLACKSARILCEGQHGPCHPLYTSMILFHHIIRILHLADGDGRAVLLVIAFDRGFIGVTAVNGDHFGEAVAADRLLQKPERGLCVPVLG